MTDQELIEADSADGWKAKYEHLEVIATELATALQLLFDEQEGPISEVRSTQWISAMNQSRNALKRFEEKDGAK